MRRYIISLNRETSLQRTRFCSWL